MIEKIIHKIKIFIKKIKKDKEIPKLAQPNDIKISTEQKEKFKNQLQNKAEEKIRIINLQKQIEEGIKKEEELEKIEVISLRNLYCEQILNLKKKIDMYS